MRKPFVAGNWKMNTDTRASASLARDVAGLVSQIDSDRVDVAICPPFVYLQQVANSLSGSRVALGAQNVYHEANGAFTGEISCAMLKDVCCTYVIIGHSERRHIIGETDGLINKKLKAAIVHGLLPIFCVGELLEEREQGKTEAVVSSQIKNGLGGLSDAKLAAVTIAYEPVWAIGTGRTATPQQAQEVHAMIRKLLGQIYSRDIAEEIRIQYGGSVKADNAAALMAQPDIDGLLVGGASLKKDDFAAIVASAAKSRRT